MDRIYRKDIMLLASRCDACGELDCARCFELFMDFSMEHAESLGSGLTDFLPKNLYWLVVKTKVRFYRRPRIADTVTLTTWPELPDKVACNRDCTMSVNGEVLAAAKTQWAVLNTATGTLERTGFIYPPELGLTKETALDEPFSRILDRFPDPPFASYRVRSTDIDLGHHMNNVAYVRAIEGLFSAEEWAAMRPDSVEVQYRSSCYEGDLLEFRRRQEDNRLYLKASVGDTPVIFAVLELAPEKQPGQEK